MNSVHIHGTVLNSIPQPFLTIRVNSNIEKKEIKMITYILFTSAMVALFAFGSVPAFIGLSVATLVIGSAK